MVSRAFSRMARLRLSWNRQVCYKLGPVATDEVDRLCSQDLGGEGDVLLLFDGLLMAHTPKHTAKGKSSCWRSLRGSKVAYRWRCSG